MSNYELTFKIITNTDPRGLLFEIQSKIKDTVNVISMDYHLIDKRPTDVEHHGGELDVDS